MSEGRRALAATRVIRDKTGDLDRRSRVVVQ